MGSSWRVNAGLLGRVNVFSNILVGGYTLAARFRLSPSTFVTNFYGKGFNLAAVCVVPPGTGYSQLFTTTTKPAGRDSAFPYGIDVLPDLPNSWDV